MQSWARAYCLKTWPGLALICLLVRSDFSLREKALFTLSAGVVPGLVLLATVAVSGGGVPDSLVLVRRALQAGAIPGWWGYTGLINGVRWLAGRGAG